MIIGLSGYAQTGKDTAAGFMAPRGVERLAFADPLKAVALDLNPFVYNTSERIVRLGTIVGPHGWEYAKRVPEVRQYLQRLGVAVREHVDPDAWVRATMRRVEPGRDFAITDVRFPNEAQAVRDAGGAVVRVVRPGVEAVNAHISETALDGWDFDYTLLNDGSLDELAQSVSLLLDFLGVRQ